MITWAEVGMFAAGALFSMFYWWPVIQDGWRWRAQAMRMMYAQKAATEAANVEGKI